MVKTKAEAVDIAMAISMGKQKGLWHRHGEFENIAMAISMCRCVSVNVGVCRCAPVCAGVCRCVSVDLGTSRCVSVCGSSNALPSLRPPKTSFSLCVYIKRKTLVCVHEENLYAVTQPKIYFFMCVYETKKFHEWS